MDSTYKLVTLVVEKFETYKLVIVNQWLWNSLKPRIGLVVVEKFNKYPIPLQRWNNA